MLIFGLHSTSDDRPSNLSNESWPKCDKSKSLKNEMLVFGLRSNSDDRPCIQNRSWWNAEKGPLSHQKMKYSFLYYVQLLMIGQAMMKVDQNASDKSWSKCHPRKKLHVISVRVFCCFSLGLLLFQSGSSSKWCPPSPRWQGRNRVAEKFRFFRFMFNKFKPKDNSVQSLLHLLAMQLICDGQCTNWFTLHFYNL